MATIGTSTIYLENRLINLWLRNYAYSPPEGAWLALYTSIPNEERNNTSIEVYGGGYARQNISASLVINGNTATNTASIIFPEATSDWGTVVAIGIMDTVQDAFSEPEAIFLGTMDNEVTINTGEIFSISPGNLVIELKGGTKGGWGNGIPERILNFLFKDSAITPTATTYLATGSGLSYDEDYNFVSWRETSGTGYARQSLSASDWLNPTNGSTCNLTDVVFSAPPIAANWGRIANVVIFNAATSGSPLFWGKLRSPIYITTGDGLKFPSWSIGLVLD